MAEQKGRPSEHGGKEPGKVGPITKAKKEGGLNNGGGVSDGSILGEQKERR